MPGLGCGCGCNGSGSCGGADNGAPLGNFGAFGYPMSADGVPVSYDLPGYEAVAGSLPGFNAPAAGGDAGAALTPGVTPSGLDTKLFGCPIWIWAVAAGLVLFDRKRQR